VHYFVQLISNNGLEILIAMLIANISAQIIKTIIFAFKNKNLDYSFLLSTGGMPSSHSSTVTAMAASTGLIEGWTSTLFAISVCVASIVMYDAAGVRRAASRQAKVLNQIIMDFLNEGHVLKKEKLKELLGHQPIEVFAGAVLGVVISFLLRFLLA
jgi:uncharacterized protein